MLDVMMGHTLLPVLELFLVNTLLCIGVAEDAVLTLEQGLTEVFVGESVTFICDMRDGEDANWLYSVRRNGYEVIRSKIYKPLHLTTAHSGEYQCSGDERYSPYRRKDSNTITLTVSDRPTATLIPDKQVIPVGGNVTLTCSVGGSSAWKYDWYTSTTTSESPIQTADVGPVITVHKGGLYWCSGGRGNPLFMALPSNPVSIVKTVPNRAVVTLESNWPWIFTGETIALRCDIQGGGDTEWEYEWETNSSNKAPENYEYRISSVSLSNSGDYRCKGKNRSDVTEWSDVIKVTVSRVTAPKPPEVHYGLKNSSVCLHRGTSFSSLGAIWIFEEELVTFDKNVTPNYRGKADYNPKNQSLCINNLTEADSGSYKLSINNHDYTTSTEMHTLTVQEAVPSPIIRTLVLSSNLSAGLCNFTVNCSVHDDWVWSACDETHCPTSHRSFAEVNITVAADNKTITCSGNNHVSESKVSERVERTCLNEIPPKLKEESKLLTVVTLLLRLVVIGALFICAAIVLVIRRILSTKHKNLQEETAVAPPVQSHLVQNALEELSSDQTEAEYENVEPSNAAVTPKQEVESEPSLHTDTVYCLLQLPEKSDKGKEKKGNKETGEGAAAETVYSALEPVPTQPQSLERFSSEASEESSVSTRRDEETV